MPDKLTLEDLARAEAQTLRERERARLTYAEAQRQLLIELPQHFLTLARDVRDGVRRFNEVAYRESGPRYVIHYEESPNVTTRDVNPERECWFQLRRDPNHLQILLSSMWRAHQPDAVLITGDGMIGRPPQPTRCLLRIEGLCSKTGDIRYRISCNQQEIDTPLTELPEHIVTAVVTGQLSRLWIKPPWTDNS